MTGPDVAVDALAERLDAAPVVRIVREALGRAEGTWIVGGAIRDGLLGRSITDVDLVVSSGERDVARAVGRAAGCPAFALSEQFGAWRVSGDGWQVDVSTLRADSLEGDLALRDFTVNAIAVPVGGGTPVDPLGGIGDLEAGCLRAAGPTSFVADPLRLLRAARLAGDLRLAIEDHTLDLAHQAAPRAAEPAGERQFAELRLGLGGRNPLGVLALMDRLAITPVVLPEIAELGGVGQSHYHHLDVHGHTLAVLAEVITLPNRLEDLFGERAPAVAAALDRPLADDLTHSQALRFAALLHDAGKPQTRGETDTGRVTFFGHDKAGETIAGAFCRRMRTSRALRQWLELLVREHLRLGFLVHSMPLERRMVHDYLSATHPAPLDVTLLTVADRLSTRGRKADEAIGRHLDLVRHVVPDVLAWEHDGPPSAPVRGDELAEALEMRPGPELGALLAELAARRWTGEIATREDAIACARALRGTLPAT
ncbi:MAG: HD domain-containing protein [Solirubrobacterales bacterium]